MINFSIAAMNKGPIREIGTLPPEFPDLAPDDTFKHSDKPFSYDFTGKLVSGGAIFTGQCSGFVKSFCGRCLEETEIKLELNDCQLFFELAPNQEEIDISGDLREELLLLLPMNPLCKPDCKGLCPKCGIDLNKAKCDCVMDEDNEPLDKSSPWDALNDIL